MARRRGRDTPSTQWEQATGADGPQKEKRQRRSKEGFASSLLEICIESARDLRQVCSSARPVCSSAHRVCSRLRRVCSSVRLCPGLRLTASRESEASRLAHCCGRSTNATREITSCRLPASRRSMPTPDATLSTWCLERPRVAGSSPVTPRSSRTTGTRGGQVQASFSSLSPSSLRADEVHLFLGICVCVCVLGPRL